MAHSSYTREDPIGVWLREGLARTLHNEYRYGCSPASLLIPQGAHRRILRRQVTRASGVWGRFLHALAHADLRIDDEWIHLEAPALLELPWYIEGQSPNLPAPWTAKTYRTISNRGWITWADVLWKSTPTSKFQTLTPAWPLAPPSPSSTKANHIPRPNTSADRKGPSMGTMFGPFWRSLPLVMQRKLQTTSTGIFEPTADPALQQMRRRDTFATHFPWHKLLVNGKPWTKTTTRQTRTALNRTTPVIITWPGAAMSTPLKQWTQSWTELHSCPLPNRIISDCYLWLHQRTWLATTDDTTLPCPHPLCTCTDSAHHSFVLCPWATTLWTSALTTVHALGVHYPLSMTPELVALGWPDVVHYRPRLILWRTVVIHLLTQLRRPALSRAKSSGTFSLPTASVDRFRSSLQRLLSEAIGLAWARFQAKQERDTHIPLSVFEHQWTRNSTFVTVAPPPPPPPANTLIYHFF
ncbi:hypothetical protein CF336_g9054 [Tilletia laevis]|nr:hypothetical protein CF336_g9054 [Tilletia laevis]